MPGFRPFLRLFLALSVLASLTAGSGAAKAEIVVVPPGNRSATQPAISVSSVVRTAETKGTFDQKYRAIYDQLAANRELIQKIERLPPSMASTRST